MKKLILLFILFLSITPIHAQIKFSDFIDEYTVSINQALSSNKKQKNTGFGLGVYHTISPSSYLNILVGFEYNRVNEFYNTNYSSHFDSKANEYFRLNFISFPIQLRFIAPLGSHNELFFNPGVYLDFAQKSRTEYDYYSVHVNNNVPTYFTGHIYENVGSNLVGISFGTGMKFKKLEHDYLIHLDVKIPVLRLMNEVFASYIRLSLGMSLKK
jgi:hypothetical protein